METISNSYKMVIIIARVIKIAENIPILDFDICLYILLKSKYKQIFELIKLLTIKF